MQCNEQTVRSGGEATVLDQCTVGSESETSDVLNNVHHSWECHFSLAGRKILVRRGFRDSWNVPRLDLRIALCFHSASAARPSTQVALDSLALRVIENSCKIDHNSELGRKKIQADS